jgi:histidinol phosphatase-like enzyme
LRLWVDFLKNYNMKIIFLDLDGVLKKIPSAKERKSRAEKS